MKKIILVLLLVLLAFAAFFFLRKETDDNIEHFSSQEESTEELSNKISSETVDLSYRYSKKEKEKIRKECEDILSAYLPLYFNYPTKKNQTIFSYHHKSDSDFYKNSPQYFWADFIDLKSQYLGHEIAYFEIQDSKDLIVQVGCKVDAKVQAKGLSENEYDVLATVSLIKNKKWEVDDFCPSLICKKGTLKFTKNDVDGLVNVDGDYVDTFQPDYTVKDRPFGDERVHGDIIYDEEEFPESTEVNLEDSLSEESSSETSHEE